MVSEEVGSEYGMCGVRRVCTGSSWTEIGEQPFGTMMYKWSHPSHHVPSLGIGANM